MSVERRDEEHDTGARAAPEAQPTEAQVEDLDVPEDDKDAVKGGFTLKAADGYWK